MSKIGKIKEIIATNSILNFIGSIIIGIFTELITTRLKAGPTFRTYCLLSVILFFIAREIFMQRKIIVQDILEKKLKTEFPNMINELMNEMKNKTILFPTYIKDVNGESYDIMVKLIKEAKRRLIFVDCPMPLEMNYLAKKPETQSKRVEYYKQILDIIKGCEIRHERIIQMDEADKLNFIQNTAHEETYKEYLLTECRHSEKYINFNFAIIDSHLIIPLLYRNSEGVSRHGIIVIYDPNGMFIGNMLEIYDKVLQNSKRFSDSDWQEVQMK